MSKNFQKVINNLKIPRHYDRTEKKVNYITDLIKNFKIHKHEVDTIIMTVIKTSDDYRIKELIIAKKLKFAIQKLLREWMENVL